MSKRNAMRITYSAEADALSVELVPDASATRMVKIAPDANADLDSRGRLVSIEILQASAYYDRAVLDQLAATSDEITLVEAAEESGLALTTLRNQIRAGKLTGVKRGRDWFVERAELWNYLERRGAAGRPSNAERVSARQRAGR